MLANRIAVTLTKLSAIFIVVSTARSLADYVFYLAENAPGSVLIGSLIFHVLIPMTIAWALWRFPNVIASSVSPGESDEMESHGAIEPLMLVGVALLGLYALVFGVIDLLYFESYRYAAAQIARLADFPESPVSPQLIAGRVTNIVQILFGIALILGRKQIVELVGKARGAGISRPD